MMVLMMAMKKKMMLMTAGECVPAGDKAECGGDNSGTGQTEDGAGPPGHSEHGHHWPHCAQQGSDFHQVSEIVRCSVREKERERERERERECVCV